MPVILEAVRSGQVHLAGLRVLAPHLTTDNQGKVLAEAAGKSKREIEELVARHWPQPPVPAVVRKLPDRPNSPPEASPAFLFGTAIPVTPPESSPALPLAPLPALAPRRDERRAVIAPLAEDTFKFQFTASRACREKLRQAQDLLRHRIPDGDLATIFERALDLLIEHVKKQRFAEGRKARQAPTEDTEESFSRHIPDAIKREVFERDGGRCTFSDERGRRCSETGALEFDHRDGFARTHVHRADRIRLLCRGQSARCGADVWSRVHGTSTRIARPASNSSGHSFRVNLTRRVPPRGELHGSRLRGSNSLQSSRSDLACTDLPRLVLWRRAFCGAGSVCRDV